MKINLIKIYDEHSEYSEKIISDYDEKLKQEVSIKLYKKNQKILLH